MPTSVAGSLKRVAVLAVAITLGLLAILVLPGCGWRREFVRQGVVLDSLAVRNDRIERQGEELRRLQAQLLADVEQVRSEQATFDARLTDLDERIARIGRRLGVWQTATMPDEWLANDSLADPDSAARFEFEPPSGIDPDQLYNTAYLDFTRGMYKVAIAGFEQYLELFPDTDLASNAQYWISECFYAQGELTRAEEEFKKVLIRYPTGRKVPDATYKLGLVYLAQNRPDAARRQFEAVVERYPGTTVERLARERLDR